MYADGGGLYLRVAEGGSKNWVFRYTANGRLRDMGLGPVHTLSLAEARDAATECRKLRPAWRRSNNAQARIPNGREGIRREGDILPRMRRSLHD
jgi:hypothetical protein